MDLDRITVVTGEPRSGTSLMMQTLHVLGVPIIGDKWPQERRIWMRLSAMSRKVHGEPQGLADAGIAAETPDGLVDDPKGVVLTRIRGDGSRWFYPHAEGADDLIRDAAKQLGRAKELNPGGFWELGGIVMRGMRRLRSEHGGRAIKIIVNGLYERTVMGGRGNRTLGTPESIIGPVILCLRDPRHIAVSQAKLDRPGIRVAGGLNMDEWVPNAWQASPQRYVQEMGGFVAWLVDHWDFMDRVLVVDYEDMRTEPGGQIAGIVGHLGINPALDQIKAACDNVDPLLKRSTDFTGWTEADECVGQCAEAIYDALLHPSRTKLQAVMIEFEAEAHRMALERVRWTDDAVSWLNVRPEMWRWISRPDRRLKTQMERRTVDKRAAHLVCDECKHYSRDPAHTYTIERPADIGDLTRPMVACARDNDLKTIEQCLTCWQRGWMKDGVLQPAERRVQHPVKEVR